MTVLGVEIDGRLYLAGVVAGHPVIYPTGRDGPAVPFAVQARGPDLATVLASFRNVYAEWVAKAGPIGADGTVTGLTITEPTGASAAPTVMRRWYDPREWEWVPREWEWVRRILTLPW